MKLLSILVAILFNAMLVTSLSTICQHFSFSRQQIGGNTMITTAHNITRVCPSNNVCFTFESVTGDLSHLQGSCVESRFCDDCTIFSPELNYTSCCLTCCDGDICNINSWFTDCPPTTTTTATSTVETTENTPSAPTTGETTTSNITSTEDVIEVESTTTTQTTTTSPPTIADDITTSTPEVSTTEAPSVRNDSFTTKPDITCGTHSLLQQSVIFKLCVCFAFVKVFVMVLDTS